MERSRTVQSTTAGNDKVSTAVSSTWQWCARGTVITEDAMAVGSGYKKISYTVVVSVGAEFDVVQCLIQAAACALHECVDEFSCCAIVPENAIGKRADDIQVSIGAECETARIIKTAATGRHKNRPAIP